MSTDPSDPLQQLAYQLIAFGMLASLALIAVCGLIIAIGIWLAARLLRERPRLVACLAAAVLGTALGAGIEVALHLGGIGRGRGSGLLSLLIWSVAIGAMLAPLAGIRLLKAFAIALVAQVGMFVAVVALVGVLVLTRGTPSASAGAPPPAEAAP